MALKLNTNLIVALLCVFGCIIVLYKFLPGSHEEEGLVVRQSTKDLEERERLISQELKGKLEKGSDGGKPCCRRDENNLRKFTSYIILYILVSHIQKRLNKK